ncbi:hypothetical protein P8452_74878 [Trifolium repens]|nr:hypothetical protein P8452_74878 [Trifolium repens]
MAAEDIYSGSEQMDTNGDENVTQGSQSPIAATEVSQPATADYCLLFYPNSLLLQFCKHCSFNYNASDYEIESCKKGSCNCAIVADHIEGGIVGEFDEANQGLICLCGLH